MIQTAHSQIFLEKGDRGELFSMLLRLHPVESAMVAPGAGNQVHRGKREKVNHYVDLFFDGVLFKAHHGKVNRLLNRERLIRSAYLFYFREAMPQKTAVGVVIGAPDSEYSEDEED